MSKKVGVVIRHLPHNRPTCSMVISEPTYQVDDLEHYFNSIFEDHKKDFCKDFVEFNNAEWYLDIMTVI